MNTNVFPYSWGWSDFFAKSIAEEDSDSKIARVINQEKGLYRLQTDDKTSSLAQLSGRFQHQVSDVQDLPSVGDWVFYTQNPNDDRALIQKVITRKSCFYRGQDQIVASNLDVVFIVTSANYEMKLNRLDRYIAITWESGAVPVIVLSKIDLCDDLESLMAEIEERHVGVPLIPISATKPESLLGLRPCLKEGHTVALLGSSGVGKSTLANGLLGKDLVATGEIREDDHKGRHTTTSRQLYRLDSGALLMDTPGMRSLALGDHSEGFEHHFAEIIALTEQCRFSDCQHRTEPGCRILEALEAEELDPAQWESYCKLEKEVAYLKRREDPVVYEKFKKDWKKISQNAKIRVKMKSRGEV